MFFYNRKWTSKNTKFGIFGHFDIDEKTHDTSISGKVYCQVLLTRAAHARDCIRHASMMTITVTFITFVGDFVVFLKFFSEVRLRTKQI